MMANLGSIVLIGAVIVVPLVILASRKKLPDEQKPTKDDLDPSSPPDDDPGEKGGTHVPSTDLPDKPIAVGEASDPLVAPYLATLATEFINHGVNIQRIKPFDLTVMTKAPLVDGPDPGGDKTRPVAIPPKELWPGFFEVASVVNQIDSQWLADLELRFTGYRPKDYNEAVGGAPKSRHIWADAIDIWLGKKLLANGSNAQIKAAREQLRMAVARYIVQRYKSTNYGFGFGVYTNDIHIDIGRKAGQIVTWEKGGEYIEKAKKELGVA